MLTQRLARVYVPLLPPAWRFHLRAALAAAVLLFVARSSAYYLPLYLGWPLGQEDMEQRVDRLDPWDWVRENVQLVPWSQYQ